MHFIEKFKDGDRISDVYLCKSKSTALTKSGKEYENVMLQDKTGQMDSKIWDPSSGGICDFDAMDYVAVTGQVISFNGALQLKIERIRKADEGEYVPSDYIPCSKYDIEEMYTELMQYIGSVKNEYLSALLKSFFTDDADFIAAILIQSDLIQILAAKRLALKIIIEPGIDRRSDGKLGLRIQTLYRFCQHMGCRMTVCRPACRILKRQNAHGRVMIHNGTKVHRLAIHLSGAGHSGQSLADVPCDLIHAHRLLIFFAGPIL